MATRLSTVTRPKNLNLLSIKLPVPAVISILHRVSGFVLILAIPGLLMAFQLSLRSPESFANLVQSLHHPLVKLPLLGLVAAFTHHFFAGFRHLAMDVHWGTPLVQARLTAKLVLLLDALVMVFVIFWLW